jgi:hypothetical protein
LRNDDRKFHAERVGDAEQSVEIGNTHPALYVAYALLRKPGALAEDSHGNALPLTFFLQKRRDPAAERLDFRIGEHAEFVGAKVFDSVPNSC